MITITLQNSFFGTFICPNDAIGWDSFEHALTRSDKWKSVFDSFGLSITFFGGAYRFLLDCYNRFGQDVEVSITVTESDYLGNQLTFNGLLNFAEDAIFNDLSDSVSAPDDYRSRFITLQVVPVPSDLKTLLESRAKAKIEIPIAIEEIYKGDPPTFFFWHPNNPAPLDLQNNSITDLRLYRPDKLFVHSRTQYNTDIYRHPQYPYRVSQGAANALAVDWFFQQELDTGRSPRIQTSNETNLTDGNNATAIQPFFTAAQAGAYRFKVRMQGEVQWRNQGISNNSRLDFRLGYGSVSNAAWYSLYTTARNTTLGGSRTETINANLDATIYLDANENVYFYQRLDTNASTAINQIIDFAISDFSIELSEIRYDIARLTDGYFAHEFTAAVLNMIIGREVLQSTVLGRQDSYPTAYAQDGNAGLLFITNGFLLRKNYQAIQTSFDELWTSLDSCYNLGLWADYVNDKIVIENARFFYNPNLLAGTFDNVPNIKVTVAGDKLYNEISFRFNKYEDRGSELNLDPHSEVSFIAPLRFTANEFSLDCPYIASGESITIAKNAGFERAEDDKTGYDTDKFFITTARTNRVKLPVMGASDSGDRLFIGFNDCATWYFERFYGTKPWFAGSFPDVFPQQFQLFNAGINNGTYAYNILGGRANGEIINITPPFADVTQIVPGVSYVEVITRDPIFPYIAQSNQNYTLIENYENEISGFNYDLTPTRNLLRHKFFWNVGVLKTPDRLWRFGSGEGNIIFTSKKDAAAFDSDEYLQNPLKQNGNILPFDELLAARYMPEYIEFEAPVTIPQWIELQTNRHGVVRVSDREQRYFEGYIIEAKRVREGEKVIGKFKLIRKFDGLNGNNDLPPKL